MTTILPHGAFLLVDATASHPVAWDFLTFSGVAAQALQPSIIIAGHKGQINNSQYLSVTQAYLSNIRTSI